MSPMVPHGASRLMALVPCLLAFSASGCTADKDSTSADDTNPVVDTVDLDGDGYGSPADCDDGSAAISPGATESCNGLDDDCDGQTDEYGASDGTTWYPDADGDGYGDINTPVVACTQPDGTIADGTDCDDANAASAPGLTESCDGIDDDCDGEIDENGASGGIQLHVDADGDGYGDPDVSVVVCKVVDGYLADASDCDDTDPEVNPLADELCDEVDNNCDGETDGDDAVGARTWYADSDSDGYGLADVTATACDKPTGYASRSGDCTDTNANINPGEREQCNGFDDNCDGVTDTDAYNAPTWYYDADEDGYGIDSVSATQCDAPASDYITTPGDCDDDNSEVNPGVEEACFDTDGVDNNCDGLVDAACYYGKLNYQEGFSTTKGERDCDLWWDTVWQPTSSICDECDFSFDVTFTEDLDSSTGSCFSGVSESEPWELGVDFDYYGTGEARVWYSITYDYDYDYYYYFGATPAFSYTFVSPMFDAYYYGSSGKLTFSDGYYDYPYRYGRKTYYFTDWTYGYVDLNGD